MVHQQPDASEVSKTSYFRQVVHNLPPVLLLKPNARKWLRPERLESYLLWPCDHLFYPNTFLHNFGNLCSVCWALMLPSPVWRAMYPEMHLAISLRGICATKMCFLREEMISCSRAESTSLLMLANLAGCSPTETETIFDESNLQRVKLVCAQFSGTDSGCTLGS